MFQLVTGRQVFGLKHPFLVLSIPYFSVFSWTLFELYSTTSKDLCVASVSIKPNIELLKDGALSYSFWDLRDLIVPGTW